MSWLERFEKFGDQVAAGVADAARSVKGEVDRTVAEQQQRTQQTEAERQAAERHRWERQSSPTWAAPTEAVSTEEWVTHELVDPRTQQVAVTFRHPVEWSAGGEVLWPVPGEAVRYAAGASTADRSCVVERFPRVDLVSGVLAGAGQGRQAVPGGTPEEVITRSLVPRLRGREDDLVVLSTQAIDPSLYLDQPVARDLSPTAYLVSVEYDRAGTPWADEMIVLRYQLPPAGGLVSESRFGFGVWSLNANREQFPRVRALMRAVALSARTQSDWDARAAELTGVRAPL